MNKELEKFSTDELLEEIKCRLTNTGLRVQNLNNKPEYSYATGIVTSLTGCHYRVRLDDEYADENNNQPALGVRTITGVFNSKNSPRVGDRVKMKCRITKACPKFNIYQSRIIEVIERNER